ncbi:MAG: CHASE3 domain-containing protein, partial [Chitinophagaceae bacterium]
MNTFKRNLLIGYSISLVLLVISSVASYISINNLLSSSQMVRKTNAVIRSLDKVQIALKNGESGQRGYLLTGEDPFLTPYKGAYENGIASIEDVRKNIGENQQQQQVLNQIRQDFERRFDMLERVINMRHSTGKIDVGMLEAGRKINEQVRNNLQVLESQVQADLTERTESLNRFATITPVMIVIAALLSFIITIVSFLRVSSDFEKRDQLQKELLQKDENLARRISIIQNLAEKIAAGQYQTRVDDEGKDVLGNLGNSLNKMAASLQKSFNDLTDKEWLQTGITHLNERIIGEKNIELLTYNVIEFVTEYTQTGMGAFYLNKDGKKLELSASVMLDKSRTGSVINWGDGVAGQAAQSGKPVLVNQLPQTDSTISYAAGEFKPVSVFAVPVYYEEKLKGVIELDSVEKISPVVQEFLKAAVFNVGMAIHSARDHQRLQEYLEETQAQSEELQSQHSELENINAELEAQAEKLQASEEELKVQQEELQQANQELEERSRLLEEKNELILERNLEIQAKAEALELSTRYKSEFLANMS